MYVSFVYFKSNLKCSLVKKRECYYFVYSVVGGGGGRGSGGGGNDRACYGCGATDHMARECPNSKGDSRKWEFLKLISHPV